MGHWPYRLGKTVVASDGFYYHFCRYVYLVGGDVFRFRELLNDEKGLFLGCACGVIAELVEIYEGFGYWVDKEWAVSSCGVCVGYGRIGCEFSNMGDFH